MAHGSRDPRAAATTSELVDLVAARGPNGLPVRAAFLEHAAPSLPQVLGALAADHVPGRRAGGQHCVVVPLLLAAAYHSKTDIPGQVTRGRSGYRFLDVRIADPLGPHPLLLAALDRRLAAAYDGPRPATSVVLAAAGSSDPAANAANASLAARWQRTGGWRRVVPAYASAAAPTPAEAVAALRAAGHGPVVVATYLLAPGFFADRIRTTALAAGAAAVSGALGAAPEVADVILGRYAAAIRAEGAGPLAAQA
ncbi:MAG TPA: CbiX/SirB N-terminal domain-containing protein [Trebonia sp.]|nr:CbiX/SirB N-terminal domain-containing protein [Trebonia sp.]